MSSYGWQIVCLCLVTMLACTRESGNTGPAARPIPSTGPNGAPQAPQSPAQGPFAGNGTFTSGGGNGINGRAVETYQVNIETLPEYKHHILPILRRMSQGRPDVFIVYLDWAVRQKAWYFVPVELAGLPRERIQLAFQSDQLALHAETEIFIHEPSYRARSSEERAALLLHEMVMAAKLLMKKSARVQCEALSKGTDLDACHDIANLKSAAATEPAGDVHRLGGVDHAEVRTMTSFLRDVKRNLNAASVFAMRTQLGFRFPWDSSLSNVSSEDLRTAVERAALAEDSFDTIDEVSKKPTGRCLLNIARWPQQSGLNLELFITVPAPASAMPSFLDAYASSGKRTEMEKSGVNINQSSGSLVLSSNPAMTYAATIESRGAIEAMLSEETVDVVRTLPHYWVDWQDAKYTQFEFFISRGSAPRLLGYKAVQVAPLLRATREGFDPEVEWVPVKSQIPIFCKLSNSI